MMTIVAILMGISIVGFTGVRKGSRDTQRKADLEKVASSYETYRSDCGHYPDAMSSPTRGNDPFPSSSCPVSNVYLQLVPSDPISTLNYQYVPDTVAGVTVAYSLCAYLEIAPSTPVSAACTISCGSIGGSSVNCNYEVTSP